MTATLLSIVTPAFNEAENLPVLYERLSSVLAGLKLEWEWVIVDDHSVDATFSVIGELAAKDPRVRGYRFARNSGSHAALECGIHAARGACAAVLAADLQDPPECIGALMEKWKAGAKVVWAVRESREGETAMTTGFSRIYYWIMRNLAGMKDLPPTGADFMLVDRVVLDAVKQFPERNVSVTGLITWLGFRQDSVPYTKQARLHGRSGWNLQKKLKLVADSITSFSYFPIRAMSYCGLAAALLGFLYAIVVIVNRLLGEPAAGWSSLMVVILVMGGLQMVMMGVLGEYVWRGLDEARRRPPYIIEAAVNEAGKKA